MIYGTGEIARVVHAVNRELQKVSSDPAVSPPWAEAPDWQRASAIAGVEAIRDGEVTSPESSHKGWCAQKVADGWVYGETKDADARTHPCLVPYSELPSEQQLKDILFTAIVTAMIAVP